MPSYTSGGSQAPAPEEKKTLPPAGVASGYSSVPVETYAAEAPPPTVMYQPPSPAPAPTVQDPSSGYATEPQGQNDYVMMEHQWWNDKNKYTPIDTDLIPSVQEPQGQNDVLWNVGYAPANAQGKRVFTVKDPSYGELESLTSIGVPGPEYYDEARDIQVRGARVSPYPLIPAGSNFPGKYAGDKNWEPGVPETQPPPPAPQRSVLQNEARRADSQSQWSIAGAPASYRRPAQPVSTVREVRPGQGGSYATEPMGDDFTLAPSSSGSLDGPYGPYLRDPSYAAEEEASKTAYLDMLERYKAAAANDINGSYAGEENLYFDDAYEYLLPGFQARSARVQDEAMTPEEYLRMYPGLFGSGLAAPTPSVIVPDALTYTAPSASSPGAYLIQSPPPEETLFRGRHITHDARNLPPQTPYITRLPNSPTKNGTR